MSINELPEECFLIIFDSICALEDLINCYKVCRKWSYLIAKRTRKIKYLVAQQEYWNKEFSNKTIHYSYFKSEEPIDGSCLSTLFPNLMIVGISEKLCKKVKHENVVNLVKKMKPFGGVICDIKGQSILQYCNELEMLDTNYIDPCMEKIGVSVKQLYLEDYMLDKFKNHAHYLPNLERLHIDNRGFPDGPYDGPILSKLKIVELGFSSIDGEDIYYGFQFMDSCPNLQSAHIYLDSSQIFIDESLEHKSLQDLLIQFTCSHDLVDWDELKRLFMKYPNLKHLALHSKKSLENEHVEQLVCMLPKLVLFDVRGCSKVTQNAANNVQDYCQQHGRSIKFYFNGNYNEVYSDWPQLSTKSECISRGFDFMKHCFLKRFRFLPTFLISNED